VFRRVSWTSILLVALISILAIGWGYIQLAEQSAIVDEARHFNQINSFAHGNFSLDPELTTIPGYHALMALICRVFDRYSLNSIRFLNSLIAFAVILVFYFTACRLSSEYALTKTLQFLFLPILFPFLSLAYTDTLSLLLVLLAYRALQVSKYNLALLMALLSVFVRQNNIIWLLYVVALEYVRRNGCKPGLSLLLEHLKRSWIAILALTAFALFVLYNGGVALGHVKYHPAFSLQSGNVFFFLFISFFLFAPQHMLSGGKMLRQLARDWRTCLALLLLAGFYLFTYRVDNPLNFFQFHLRNQLLLFFVSSLALKALFFVITAWALLFFLHSRLSGETRILLYSATVLFLVPAWLIEQRYYLIPLMFFMLLKKEDSSRAEYLTVLLYMVACYCLLGGISAGKYFL